MNTKANYSLTTLATSDIDVEAGVIRNVAIMTEGEAKGHGLRVDLTTLQGLYELAKSGGIKAFLNHSALPSPTEAIGIFSGFFLDIKEGEPAKLRATFKALRAFKEHSAKEYATLFELASEAPESFGISVSIWQDNEEDKEGGMPFIRPTEFESADFVSTPAANKAIFAKPCIDVSDKNIQQVSNLKIQDVSETQLRVKNNAFSMKTIYAKFSASPKKIARAVQLMAECDTITEDAAIEAVESEATAEDIAALKQSVIDLTAERDALAAKVAELTGETEKLSAPAAEVPALKAEVAKLSAERDSLQKTANDYAAKLARFGISPLRLTVKTDKPAPVALTCTPAEFSAKTSAQKAEFSVKGGRIVDTVE